MVGYNGCYISFKQYMPAKLITHGIKLWALAYVMTKIVLKLEVYVGAYNEAILRLPIHACDNEAGVVTTLTSRLELKNYIEVMDNFFSNPLVFDDLLRRGFYVKE